MLACATQGTYLGTKPDVYNSFDGHLPRSHGQPIFLLRWRVHASDPRVWGITISSSMSDPAPVHCFLNKLHQIDAVAKRDSVTIEYNIATRREKVLCGDNHILHSSCLRVSAQFSKIQYMVYSFYERVSTGLNCLQERQLRVVQLGVVE